MQFLDSTGITDLVNELQTKFAVLPKIATVTIDVSEWSNSTCTKFVMGVTPTNTVIISAAPSSIGNYTSAGVFCSAQGAGTLTFTCSSTPSSTITVNVLIIGVDVPVLEGE